MDYSFIKEPLPGIAEFGAYLGAFAAPILFFRRFSIPVLGGLLLAIFALFEVYAPALRGPFLFDDLALPFLRPGDDNQPLIAWLRGVRPFLMVTYWVNVKLWGLDPYWFHVVNVLLHACAGGLVWLIARKFVGHAWLATFCALVFVFHPLQTESVSYIAGRSEVVSGLFFLAAWAAFLYRRTVAIGFLDSAVVLVLYGLAVLTKEHTVVLVAVLLLSDYFFNDRFTLTGIRRNWRLYAGIAIGGVAPAIFIFNTLRTATTAGFQMKDLTVTDYLFTQFRAVWGYVQLFFFPIGQNIDHDFAISRSLLDHFSVVALLLWVAAAAFAWNKRKQWPLASFSFFLFLVLLAPTSSILPIRDVFVERRMYLPTVALALLCADFLARWKTQEVTKWVVTAAAIALLLGATLQRNAVWSSPMALWADSVEKAPSNPRAHAHLAYALYVTGNCAEASREYSRSSKLGDPKGALLLNWAAAAECAGDSALALDRLEEARRLRPSARVSAMIGMFQAKQQNYDRALEALDEAERLDPKLGVTYIYRGEVYLARKEFDLAIAQFHRALQVEPELVRGSGKLAQTARTRIAQAERAKVEKANPVPAASVAAADATKPEAGGMFLSLP